MFAGAKNPQHKMLRFVDMMRLSLAVTFCCFRDDAESVAVLRNGTAKTKYHETTCLEANSYLLCVTRIDGWFGGGWKGMKCFSNNTLLLDSYLI
jgi:hypothetical protein